MKSDQGEVVVIMRALYGLKSSFLVWHNHLEEVLGKSMEFLSLLDDPYIWFKAPMDKYGNQYYTYILFYIDDIIIV